MLNKKSVRILSIVLLVVVLLISFSTIAFADVVVPTPADVPIDANVQNTINTVLGVIKYAGILTAVVVAMFIGIKYITSSPEGKAEVKKTLGFYIAGIAILLSASGIVGLLQTTFTQTPVA